MEQSAQGQSQRTRSDIHQSGPDDSFRISNYKGADHAIVLIGFDCEKKTWKFQNSWGETWANFGTIEIVDENVCADTEVSSAHSYGAGPGCAFASSVAAFYEESPPPVELNA